MGETQQSNSHPKMVRLFRVPPLLVAFLGIMDTYAIALDGIIVVIGTLSHQDGDHF